MANKASTITPYRQIRASYDDDTITVYQAYSEQIAVPAVKEQRLSASPAFSHTRMTWIKPSWCWMMYRAGYSYKDKGQARILALRIKHENFQKLLSQATVTHGQQLTASERENPVRVQWDPERSPSLKVLPYRSIQIGISGKLNKTWAEEWTESIEDMTETAQMLKKMVDEGMTGEDVLVARSLVPTERVYEIPDELRQTLQTEV